MPSAEIREEPLLKGYAAVQWGEHGIDARTSQIIDSILEIWPAPDGHKVRLDRAQNGASITVDIPDLIGAGFLTAGQTLYSRSGRYSGHVATVLSDGRIEVTGQIFESPSSAGAFVRKKATNGWHFWRLESNGRRPLKDVRTEYMRIVSPEEAEEDDGDSPDLD